MAFTKLITAAALSLTLGAGPAIQAEDPIIKVQKINDTISVLFGKGGNIGVSAGEDGVFLIDDQSAPISEEIRKAVTEITGKPIDFILNTHWHHDHTGNNAAFAELGTTIIAHDNVRKRLITGGTIGHMNIKLKPKSGHALPVITFSDTLSLHLNGEEAKMVHVENAHTNGDGIVLFKKSNVIHMGDTFFNETFPLIDYDAGGSFPGILRAVDKILAIADEKTVIIPGHGPVTNKDGLATYRTRLVKMGDNIRKMKLKGMSLDDVLAANPTAEFDAALNNWGKDWKEGFIREFYKHN